jgi:hypothetical protein
MRGDHGYQISGEKLLRRQQMAAAAVELNDAVTKLEDKYTLTIHELVDLLLAEAKSINRCGIQIEAQEYERRLKDEKSRKNAQA